ncbi:MAG: methylmalonyl-CoA mutase family protein [Saprospiraceae bacterium]|jgi:methylmalonyl-CoA mutase|nr:methylmalonyl-CoA mutase family protein [Saprospiraceae bacterium]
MQNPVAYQPKNKVRLVTAASLFDGHDAAINIMRRIMQSSGAEIIHLGHNRSVLEIVDCAIQEDVQGIAITSYQGGHNEFFKYMYDLLRERGADHIKIFGGGGGTILPSEIEELHAYGITRIYHPDDGRAMGLQGMINDVLQKCDFPVGHTLNGELQHLAERNPGAVARLITIAENSPELFEQEVRPRLNPTPGGEGGMPSVPAGHSATEMHKDRADQAPLPFGGGAGGGVVLGITGTGGAGKSSMVDELVRRFLLDFEDKSIAIVSVDPSKRKTGGALLGDRIRMNAIHNPRVFMRSLATRQSNLALSKYVHAAVDVLKAARYDLIILETSGIGQSDTEIIDHSDLSLYIMTPEFGAATQLEKIDMLDFADVVAINKFDKRGALDALRDVRKQVQRNRNAWDTPVDAMPVFGCIASQFNDPGVNQLYRRVIDLLNEKCGAGLHSQFATSEEMSEKIYIIPPQRTRYLSEISENNRKYDQDVEQQVAIARKLWSLKNTIEMLQSSDGSKPSDDLLPMLQKRYATLETQLDWRCKRMLEGHEEKKQRYAADEYVYLVRDKEVRVKTFSKSLSSTRIPRVVFPRYQDWGDILRWRLQENVPGEFPYTAGVFPFKREGEDPTRMFAGEGGPERTNKRFHYVSQGLPAARLSTAFDSVTLYGEDPDYRPDIYGKIGNSGVSVCCLDDAKKLYSGFDLCDPKTSVSMTINGPAATIAAFFMNAAIDQQCEKYIRENNLEHLVEAKLKEKYDDKGLPRPTYNPTPNPSPGGEGGMPSVPAGHSAGGMQKNSSDQAPIPPGGGDGGGVLPEGNSGLGLLLLGVTGDEVLPADVYRKIKAHALSAVRGTVQADILKEDQAQNTCIFSTEFSLRVMGDVQAYFIRNKVRNFYSVSISGYHIAEAGANPISQLAFTLANGFTFVEYYVSRGMDVNDFAPNLSFFFSNGVDPEYAVIGRVARRIWAKAMRFKYGANQRSQMLKYHIQTSGRSLHAQEIAFNDIRTTLQALYAIYDNCNSLHTNAYDEAITTPTEESVRRAMAIQLIINHELGLAKNENPLQGSFIIEELTDLVEEAVLAEFDRITERGGVLGAMETMYQRGKIQEESLYYETLKHTGELPLIGVNTFLSKEGSPTILPKEVIRATEEEKEAQIRTLQNLHAANQDKSKAALRRLQQAAVHNENIFAELMEAVKVCSLGQVTNALFEVGGQYRRNM